MAQQIDRDEFIRMIAERANFTQTDIKIIWGMVEDIFQESIVNETDLNIRGFGHLYVKEFPARTGFDVHTNSSKEYPATKLVHFKLAKNLRDLKKRNGAKSDDLEDEE